MFTPLLKKFTDDKKLIAASNFVLKFFFIYFLWKAFSFLVSKEGTLLHELWTNFNNWLAANLTMHTALILKYIFSYDLVYNKRVIIIVGTEGFYIANHCLGIAPMVIFAGLIIAYEGKWWHKAWFIPLGMFGIYSVNLARMVALGATQECCTKIFLEIAHSSVYLLLSYGMFFLFVMWWMNVFSKK